jgi:hypothetical protein
MNLWSGRVAAPQAQAVQRCICRQVLWLGHVAKSSGKDLWLRRKRQPVHRLKQFMH